MRFSSLLLQLAIISWLALTVPRPLSADPTATPETFLSQSIRIGGFVEHVTGLAVSGGSRFFDTSNPLVMSRFTFQPEVGVDIAEGLSLFAAWKFVKEPRYPMETRSRKKAVQPPGAGRPLPSDFYDRHSPVPWEAVLTYQPAGILTLRWGRQFISWGEADGVRLLDLINPQDASFAPAAAPNLFSLDETRIPSWGFRALYTAHPQTNTLFEFFALPGTLDPARYRADYFVGSNDTNDRRVRYGRWSAHPETRMTFGRLFANPTGPAPIVVPSTRRELPDDRDSWKIGTRVTTTLGRLALGLGYINGINPQASDMVFELEGDPAVCGPPQCPPGATLVRFKLVNERTHIFAGHFNYPVRNVLGIPINTTARGEVALLPNKSYNISEFPGRDCQTGALTGLPAGPSCKHPRGVVGKHTLRYVFGLDRTALIGWLHPDDPWRAFNLSLQLFQSIILGHENGIRPFSSAERIRPVSTLLTFRAATGYFGDTVLPDLFVAYDPEGYYAINPAISYVPPWSEKMRLSLVGAIYGGRNKFKSFGFFSDKDSVFLKLRYQF